MDAPAPAVVAAVAQATGVRCDEIPITPERLMRALGAAVPATNGAATGPTRATPSGSAR